MRSKGIDSASVGDGGGQKLFKLSFRSRSHYRSLTIRPSQVVARSRNCLLIKFDNVMQRRREIRR